MVQDSVKDKSLLHSLGFKQRSTQHKKYVSKITEGTRVFLLLEFVLLVPINKSVFALNNSAAIIFNMITCCTLFKSLDWYSN